LVRTVYLNYIKLGCRIEFPRHGLSNPLDHISIKSLYKNHSHNQRKYEGLSLINIKDFLRQEKKFILIEYINIKINSQSYTTIMHIENTKLKYN
jgi:hypothetical protein